MQLQLGGGPAPLLLGRLLHTEGLRGLWRGAGVHALASLLGGVARLGQLRTTQMWLMPGGHRRYQGPEGFVRRPCKEKLFKWTSKRIEGF